jgi:hypothetical protein
MNVSSIGIKQTGKPAVQYMSNIARTTVSVDPASLATMTGALTAAITVTGAALGDRVELFPPYDLQGVIAQGNVSAANTVKISFFNPTGATIDLPSGAWTIQAIRK